MCNTVEDCGEYSKNIFGRTASQPVRQRVEYMCAKHWHYAPSSSCDGQSQLDQDQFLILPVTLLTPTSPPDFFGFHLFAIYKSPLSNLPHMFHLRTYMLSSQARRCHLYCCSPLMSQNQSFDKNHFKSSKHTTDVTYHNAMAIANKYFPLRTLSLRSYDRNHYYCSVTNEFTIYGRQQ